MDVRKYVCNQLQHTSDNSLGVIGRDQVKTAAIAVLVGTGWAKKSWPFLEVYNSSTWRGWKGFYTSKYSALIRSKNDILKLPYLNRYF